MGNKQLCLFLQAMSKNCRNNSSHPKTGLISLKIKHTTKTCWFLYFLLLTSGGSKLGIRTANSSWLEQYFVPRKVCFSKKKKKTQNTHPWLCHSCKCSPKLIYIYKKIHTGGRPSHRWIVKFNIGSEEKQAKGCFNSLLCTAEVCNKWRVVKTKIKENGSSSPALVSLGFVCEYQRHSWLQCFDKAGLCAQTAN